MPRYFMHLIDSVDVLLDPEGTEMSPDKVARKALGQARDCMANDVQEGHLDLGYRIEVHDENGQVIHRLEFEDALEITRGTVSA